MTKSIASSAADAALGHILVRATRITLCSGAPADATEAITAVSGGGKMLGDLTLNSASNAGFAISTGSDGARKLTIGGQTEIIGREAGISDHLAVIDVAGNEILILTELTEPQPVLIGAVVAMRSFSISMGNPE